MHSGGTGHYKPRPVGTTATGYNGGSGYTPTANA